MTAHTRRPPTPFPAGEKRTSLRAASTLARRSPPRSTISSDWRMFHRIAIGILFAESIAFAASDMIDRLFPALFPWVHIAIMGTSTAGVLWAFWPWIKPRLPMRRHEPEEAKKRAGEPTFLGAMGTLVGIIFIGPWVIAALMGLLIRLLVFDAIRILRVRPRRDEGNDGSHHDHCRRANGEMTPAQPPG